MRAHEGTGSSELELLKTDLLGRVRVPPGKREAILDAFEQSGMSGQAFAEYVGVKYPTFATWVQKRKKARGEYPEAKAVKAPLALVSEHLKESVRDGVQMQGAEFLPWHEREP